MEVEEQADFQPFRGKDIPRKRTRANPGQANDVPQWPLQ